ncbi:P-loop containing nucleoside triphosphate hydrolase protein [Aspergillus avenaceus]|uniref:P-loop containing nucleoside triphosphate hydrolase protein n=1 Tax=Aspergillus avenaceus TaxID=36643 RepID=A0A5N6TJE0_ASPAV|nr:P-loop containing nucleoside triphosphate hydrolase protein [Aspergillus avenaceus]
MESQDDPNDDSDSWLLKPELPSPEEVLGTECDAKFVDLPPNQIHGPWGSEEQYLKAHYELLREDSVAPLRDAVAYVREDPLMKDSKDVSVYEKVYVRGITFAQQGMAFRIRFSTHRAGKSIVWEYSKRLIAGSIVALSPADDLFKTKCVIAIVAARPLEGVKQQPPEVDIYFARPEDAAFDPQQEWIMVEAKTGYYESARHTMTALQKMNTEKFPLAEHICSLVPNTDAPEYVKESPVLNIHSALDLPESKDRTHILENWPRSPIGDLDVTQWRALELMLTKSLAIVQGPPGTGKTFVSVVALKMLLSNMKPGDPPVIITSQTNHALDQLLRHVSKFEQSYIRLGGRSNDPEIKKRTVFAVRKSRPVAALKGGIFGAAQKKYKALHRSITELLRDFSIENADGPLPSDLFVGYGLLSQAQYESLVKGAKGWVRPGEREDADPLLTWLGDQAVKFKVEYSAENFGFQEDEIDLEYEQLKELEAEQGVDDDDFETLKGPYMPLLESLHGHSVSLASEAACLKHLKQSDLWKIPLKIRGEIYNILCKQMKQKLTKKFRQLVVSYTENCTDLRIGKWERDCTILQDAKVIGMTTTGISKYRGLVSSLKPTTVLIEEAAETIEAPIAAACLDSIQHMILVGDHKQLRGSCSVQDLQGEPFFLDISMFERLVSNGLNYITLEEQRRMAPEIRQLLEPIYGQLQDHQSVLQRPEIPGMGDIRSYFFSHNWPESFDSLSSKFNEKEARMIAGFFIYLVLNGVRVEDITVLTFYNGQRKKLLKLFKEDPYLQGHYVKVVTVDSFQGEENEVVILSLVRSGKPTIGFLSIENRVCVALSRARSGFFIFGNAKSIASADPLWHKVVSIMGNTAKRRIGYDLPLTYPSDWQATHGGCHRPCKERLSCGHECALFCHSFSHDKVRCNEICNQTMRCGHTCNKPCFESHICHCQCPLIQAAPSDPTGLDSIQNTHSHIINEESIRQAAIRGYQAFANGGAKEQDELLLKLAESKI